MLNFSFWLNRKDGGGRDIFGGGFLGMDNIGVFDRDKPLPDGGQLEQSDGTSWMALFASPCSRSRPSWPSTIRSTRTWRSSTSSTFSTSRTR